VRRHTESDNLVFLTVLVERVTAVAPMAVYDKQTVHTNSTVLFIRVKLLQPPQTKLVFVQPLTLVSITHSRGSPGYQVDIRT
jgi:hypothetical protein